VVEVSWWEKITGLWMVAAGISLLFVFFRQYRGRGRYAYVFLLGCWAALWGMSRLRGEPLLPGWVLWLLFVLGIATMLLDSVARYRATVEELRRERTSRLHAADESPDDAEQP
jgi:hypothetical protein